MPAAKSRGVRLIIRIVKSVHQALRELVIIPSALLVPVPVNSSTERAARFPPNRGRRRSP